MTKAEQVYNRVEELMAGGMSKAEAFKKIAADDGAKPNSVRGSYYAFTRKRDEENGDAGPRRTRRRETRPEDALADARAVLDRAIAAVDADVENARLRAKEAQAEYEALRDSAEAKKEEIAAKRDALS